MKRTIIVIASFVVLLASCAEPQPEAQLATPGGVKLAVKQTKVWVGEGGIEVVSCELNNGKNVIRVTGYRSEVEGKVLEHELFTTTYGHCLRIPWHGRPFCLVLFEERSGTSRWTFQSPENFRNQIQLTHSEEKAKQLDTAPLLAQYHAEMESGELSRLQRFDRQAEEKKIIAELDEKSARTEKQCTSRPALEVRWATIDDETIKEYSIAGYCDGVLSAMRNLCRHEAGRSFFKGIKKMSCALGNTYSLQVRQGIVELTVSLKTMNLDEHIRQDLLRQPVKGGHTLKRLIEIEETDVCYADDKHVIIIAPSKTEHAGLSYGDGQSFFHIGDLPALSPGWFSDPRQYNKNNRSDWRGYDLRYYSHVDPDPKKKTCSLTCGARKTSLKLAERAKVEQILQGATYKTPPLSYEPYALARDQRGLYYFVDRGNTEHTRKDFRVFIGQRGRLKRQQMKDIVSDSEGEIFSTKNGALRLVVGKAEALWIVKGNRRKLLWLSVKENQGLIYNELGVYLEQRFGVPCDDF